MVSYAIVVSFIMTLFMNKFTNTIILTYDLFIHVPIIETNFGNSLLRDTYDNEIL